MGARFPSESVGGLDRNQCPGWAGISGRIAPEYAFGWGLHRIDSKIYTRHLEKEESNSIENAVEEIGLLN